MKNTLFNSFLVAVFFSTAVIATIPSRSIETDWGSVSSVDAIKINDATEWVTAGSWDSNDVKVFDLNTQRCIRIFSGHTSLVNAVKICPSLSSANDHALVSASDDTTIKVWSIEKNPSEACRQTLTHNLAPVTALEVYDNCIVSGAKNGDILVWNVATEQVDIYLQGHTDLVKALLYLGDGKLASASADKTVRIWDLTTRQCLFVMKGHTDIIWSLCKLDEKRIASASDDQTFKIWDITTGECMDTQNPRGVYVEALANIGQNRILYGSDPTVGVYDYLAKKYLVKDKLASFFIISVLKIVDDNVLVAGYGGNDPDKIKIIQLSDILNSHQQ